ncbi:hypothetical protein HDV05_005512 [Chytridiales sp. JEL 0842]|nr:hypothetical protein HDV05_005512 [Chytridiales sp. JEL 0842]
MVNVKKEVRQRAPEPTSPTRSNSPSPPTSPSIMPTTSWLETCWLGYQGIGSTLVGVVNFTLPLTVLSANVSNRGGGSVAQLFDSSVNAVEVAESSPAPPSVSSTTSSNSLTGGTSPGLTAALNPSAAALTAENRVAIAKENLDTLAALVATSLYQVQYALGGDVLASWLCFHALTSSTPDNERRLVHRALGVLKGAQYCVHILHNMGDDFLFGTGTLVSLMGLSLTVGASWYWGWRKPDVKTAASAGGSKKKST